MPGPIRSPEEIAALKARARERRAGGEAMQDIAEALSVPASTLYRWAAEGCWRGSDLARERYRAALRDAPDGVRGSSGQALSPHSRGQASTGSACSSGQAQSNALLPLDGGGAPEGRRGWPMPGRGEPSPHPAPVFLAEAARVPPHQGEGGAARPDADGEDDTPPVTQLEARASGEKALRAARALMEAGDFRGADLAMRLAERMLDAAKALNALPLPAGYRPPGNMPLNEARLILSYRMALQLSVGLREDFIADPSKMPPPPKPGEHITGHHCAASGLPMADGGTYPVVPRAALCRAWWPEEGE